MKRKLFLGTLLCPLCMLGFVQSEPDYREKQPYKNWVKLVPKLTDDFYSTREARRIADNVLLYQLSSGGWPKNIYIPRELTEAEKTEVIKAKANVDEGTIDNDATTTEIYFLSRVYNVTGEERYLAAVMKGIDYLFEAQYDNGGWPQCYPRTGSYHVQIQYNDDSNINVLELMREYIPKVPFIPFCLTPINKKPG